MFQVRQISYVPWDGDASELVTLAEASKLCGASLTVLIHAVERGVLTEVIDDSAVYHGRRKLLKAEVLKLLGEKENVQTQ